MKYDPIMCMMVDDSVKTTDNNPVVGKTYEIKGKKFKVLKADSNNVTVIDERGVVLHLSPAMFNSAKTLDHAIRSCDSREDDIADELFDALQQIGKRNINKNEAEFISEKFFDGKVSSDELMRIFNKYKKEYL